MTAHAFDIKTQFQADAETGEATGVLRYRWVCSCGDVGPWRTGGRGSGRHGRAARSARVGGERHVAAMERGPIPLTIGVDVQKDRIVFEVAGAPPERDQIRAILVAAGAPAEDLESLVASCTSIEDARAYRPPARDAWCVDCGNVRPCDADGCLVCRQVADEPRGGDGS